MKGFFFLLMLWCLSVAALYEMGAFGNVWWAVTFGIAMPVGNLIVIMISDAWDYARLEMEAGDE